MAKFDISPRWSRIFEKSKFQIFNKYLNIIQIFIKQCLIKKLNWKSPFNSGEGAIRRTIQWIVFAVETTKQRGCLIDNVY